MFIEQSEENETLLYNKPNLGVEGGVSLHLHSRYKGNNWYKNESINWYTGIYYWLINYH